MPKTKLLCFIYLLFNYSLYGQSLKAIVVKGNGTPMMGNALVLNPLDSTIIVANSFIDGAMHVEGLNRAEILLKLTSLEFQDYFQMVYYNGEAVVDLDTIVVLETINAFEEVTVRAAIPLSRTMPDGTVQVNVQKTILAASTSVEEILSKSPNIIIEDGVINVLGKGEAVIYLNGQRIFQEQINTIQPSEIKNIEIISNPSAKYDAEGMAVINIITLANNMEGIRGQFNQNLTLSNFSDPLSQSNFSLDLRKNKLSINTNFSLNMGTYRFILNTSRIRDELDNPFRSTITTDWEQKRRPFLNYGFGINYELSSSSYFSVNYTGNSEQLEGTETSNNTINFQGDMEKIENIVFKNSLTRQSTISANYYKELDTLGSSLFIGGQIAAYQNQTADLISEEINLNEMLFQREIENDVDLKIPINSVQIDLIKALKNQSRVELGFKYGNINNKSNSEFQVALEGQNFERDNLLSRDFAYSESIVAGYINYVFPTNSGTSLTLGVRTEGTSYQLNYGQGVNEFLERQYFNVFPNVNYSKKIGETRSIFASYSSRIDRPRYQSLNPTIIYQDAYTSIQGNPNIIPEKAHNFEIGTNLDQINIKAGYNLTLDPITGGAVQGADEKSYILQRLNSEFGHDFFISTGIPINYKRLSSSNSLTFTYSRLVDNINFSLNKTRPRAYFYSNNSFRINEQLKLQLLAWYLSDRYDGIYFRKRQSEINIGLEQSFFDNKIKLQVLANDIFHRNKPDGSYQLGETYILFDRIYNTRHFRFTATYNFGQLKKKAFDKRKLSTEENERL